MPKKENLFRFVSVRGPQTPSVIINIPADTESKKTVDEDIQRLVKEGVPLDQARLQVGSKILNGENYFRKLEESTNLIRRARDVYRLLQKHQRDPDRPSFKRDLRKLLEDNAPDSDDFLDPGSFAKIWKSLWMSFFGLVLSPLERSQDRLVIDRWIRGLYLAQSEDNNAFEKRVKTILKVRPSVPFSWFTLNSANNGPTQNKGTDVSHVPSRQIEIKKRVKLYVTTRDSLQALFVEKFREYQNLHVERPVAKSISKNVGSAQGSAGVNQQDPSRITEDDIRKYSDSFSILRSIGLNPEFFTIPDLINALDTNIANITADLADVTKREDVMLMGKAFVRVSSPINETVNALEENRAD